MASEVLPIDNYSIAIFVAIPGETLVPRLAPQSGFRVAIFVIVAVLYTSSARHGRGHVDGHKINTDFFAGLYC